MSQTDMLVTATGKQPRPHADLAAYRWLLQRLFAGTTASPPKETPSAYACQRSEGISVSSHGGNITNSITYGPHLAQSIGSKVGQ